MKPSGPPTGLFGDLTWDQAREAGRIAPETADAVVRNEGSIFLLFPLTPGAKDWIGEHLPKDATRFGGAWVIEHRYVEDVVRGMTVDGLVVK